MSRQATHVLTAVLAATEAAWQACQRGEATIEELGAVLVQRSELLARLDADTNFSPSERELALRLHALDQQLLAWCDERRSELGHALAGLPRQAPDATASSQRLLSDFA